MKKEKMKVKPEGRDGVWLVEKAELIKWLKKFKKKYIHNFVQTHSIFLGADWSVKSVIEEIKKSERLAVMTGVAWGQNMKHALAVISNNELKVFDIGEIIPEKDLEVLD